MRKLLGIAAATTVLTAGLAFAAPPTADEINRVHEYLEGGKDSGPILLEITPCLKVDKKVPEGADPKSPEAKNAKRACIEAVTGPVAKKTAVSAWMRFFVPKGAKYTEEDLKIIYKGAEDVETIPFSIDQESGSSSYGMYKSKTLKTAGEWEITVKYKDAVLGTAKVTVSK